MFKKVITVVATTLALSTSFGQLSKDEIKDLNRLIEIDRVNFSMDEDGKKEIGLLEVELSSKDFDYLKESKKPLAVRVVAKVSNEKKEEFLVETAPKGISISRDNVILYTYEVKLDLGSFRKLKLAASAVQLGLLNGKEFTPFAEDFDKVKSLDDLTKSDAAKYPNKILTSALMEIED